MSPTQGLPDSRLYDAAYFQSESCAGYGDFVEGRLSAVRERELALLDLRPGMTVLDLGCGRGDASIALRQRDVACVALDYAWDALVLTKEVLGDPATVTQADAGNLPFPDHAFDRVLLGDVIEHLPWPLAARALREIERVLKPGGTALVHTSPNTWFIALVKRPLVFAMKVLRRKKIVERFAEYDRLRALIHVNELNPISLRRLVREAGVSARTWVDPDLLRSGSSEWTTGLDQSALVRFAARVGGLAPFRLVLGNDLYALVQRAPASVDSA